VRFVDNERLRARQDLAKAFLLQRQVGQQQVVIDDDHVRRLRALPRGDDKTVGEERAFAAQAILRGAGDQRQQRRIVGQRIELGEVAHARAPGPGDDALELRGELARPETRFALRLAHAVVAQVVRAPFQQRGFHPDAERIADAWQVAVVELVLQRARAGGNDGLLARQQRGHQIGEGLAGAGAGFRQQGLA